MSAWVNKGAHKSYPVLFSHLTQRYMPLWLRIKLMAFIERKSGPDIGFYCYDLFPMINYEFYQYIYICGQNYLRIICLF